MCKTNFNAVFYSKDNVEMAYNVKNVLWQTEFQVTNVNDFTELICEIQKEIHLLIVDCKTVSLSDEFLNITNGCKFGSVDNIIFIGDNLEERFNVNDSDRFFCRGNNLINLIRINLQRFYFNIERNRAGKYDINFVNTYLTQYLISLGFLPKHVGFYYIKQCIEEAITHNGVMDSLSTKIYPCVARRNGTSAVNIERNIRNSITCANKNSENKEFVLRNISKNKPVSNRAFLSFLLDQVIISHDQMQQSLSV